MFTSVLLCSLLYWQIIERETSELEKLRLEKSAVKSQIDEKVGEKSAYKYVYSYLDYLTVNCVQSLFIFEMRYILLFDRLVNTCSN